MNLAYTIALARVVAAVAPPVGLDYSDPIVAEEAAFASERRQVTLREAMQIADHRSSELSAARAQADQAIAKAAGSYAAILPSVTLGATYDYSSAIQQFDLSQMTPLMAGAVRAAIEGVGPSYGLSAEANQQVVNQILQTYSQRVNGSITPIVFAAHDSLYGSLVVQQLLFSPQFFLLPAAVTGARAAEAGVRQARDQVLLGAAKLYLALEGLEDLQAATREAQAVAERRERDARTQTQAGMATDIAVLRAQSESAQARSTLATLAGQRMALMAMLQALVGEPIRPVLGERTKLEITVGDASTVPWSRSYLVERTSLQLSAQEYTNAYDRLAWLPSLVAQAKGSYNSNKGFAQTNWLFDGIISLQWTLYDQGQRGTARDENIAKTVEYRARLRGARANAEAEWIGARANLLAAESALALSKSQVQLAERAQQHIESAYQAGFTTNLEVTAADSQRFLAQSNAANARAQVEIRKVEFAAAEGRLAELVGLGLR